MINMKPEWNKTSLADMEAVLQTDYLMDILHTAEKNYCFNMFVSNWHHYEKWLPWDSPNNHIFFFPTFTISQTVTST